MPSFNMTNIFVFVFVLILSLSVFLFYRITNPEYNEPKYNIQLIPVVKPKNIADAKTVYNSSSCKDTLKSCKNDDTECSECEGGGDSHSFVCTEVKKGEKVEYNGNTVPEGKWCLPSGKNKNECGTYTGKYVWADINGTQEWKCACLYPDLFGGSDCKTQYACKKEGTETPGELIDKYGNSWDPNKENFEEQGTPYDYDERGNPKYICNCGDSGTHTLLPNDPYRCHLNPCVGEDETKKNPNTVAKKLLPTSNRNTIFEKNPNWKCNCGSYDEDLKYFDVYSNINGACYKSNCGGNDELVSGTWSQENLSCGDCKYTQDGNAYPIFNGNNVHNYNTDVIKRDGVQEEILYGPNPSGSYCKSPCEDCVQKTTASSEKKLVIDENTKQEVVKCKCNCEKGSTGNTCEKTCEHNPSNRDPNLKTFCRKIGGDPPAGLASCCTVNYSKFGAYRDSNCTLKPLSPFEGKYGAYTMSACGDEGFVQNRFSDGTLAV